MSKTFKDMGFHKKKRTRSKKGHWNNDLDKMKKYSKYNKKAN